MVTKRSKKLLMSLIGLLNYYRNFINLFNGKVKPLTDLLSEKVQFRWKEKAFQEERKNS